MTKYNIVSPVKNEEDHLPDLAQCIINQSCTPQTWIIIDDGSVDHTPEITNKLTTKYSWIPSIRVNSDEERSFGKHFSKIIRKGFEKSLELSNDISYLVKIDADVRFHDDVMETLVRYMDDNEDMAIVSPHFVTLRGDIDLEKLNDKNNMCCDDNIIETTLGRISEPVDGLRVYRKEFLEDIGGYPISENARHVTIAKAVVNDYGVGLTDDTLVFLSRETHKTVKSLYEWGKFSGYRHYIQRYHPIQVMISFLFRLFKNPTSGAGFALGYVESFINKKQRTNDLDIIEYNRKYRFNKFLEKIN